MQYSIVNYKTVKENSDFRVDAEYYHPVCLNIHEKIKSKNGILFFSKIKKISSGKNLPQSENGKYKFIRTQNIRPILIDDSGLSYTDNLNGLKATKEGEMLFVRVGEGVGNNSIITKNYAGNAISDNVLRLEIVGVNPFFCSTFFNSKIGQIYFKRVFKGTARSLISQENFKDIFVPVFDDTFQNLTQNLIEKSQNLIEKSQSIYSQAETLLLSELGLSDWRAKHVLSLVRNYSETEQAGRFDAEYFQPKYDEIVKTIKNYNGGWDTTKNLLSLKDKNFNPADNKEYRYIELANIGGNGEVTGYTTTNGQELPTRARRKVCADDVIVSSIEGSLSSIALITKECDNALCSTGFYVVNSDKINSETLLVLLKSPVGQDQLRKGCSGTILTAINKDELKKIVLPIVGKKIQNQIQQKIIESFNLRKQSKHLLECAKKAVEMAIEKNEKTATQWLKNQTQ